MEAVYSSGNTLHIAMLPWLAMGHILPYLHLAIRLSKKGLRVSFISTPKNISTILTKLLPPPPPAAIDFITIPFSASGHPLHDGAQSSMDINPANQPLLKVAFQTLRHPVAGFLRESKPDFILYDFPCDWIPHIGFDIGVPSAFFSIFNASSLAFFGPPGAFPFGDMETVVKALTGKPDWIPFETRIGFYRHEVPRFLSNQAADDPDEAARFGRSITGANFVAVRTNFEFESKWVDLLAKLYAKPVIPVGFLFPAVEDGGEGWDGTAVAIKEWMDTQRVDSVLYVALGTEALLSQDELTELAHGLEDSGVPFVWALRDPPESTQSASEMLPEGFQGRVKGRGLVYTGWAPQFPILCHRATRGFLTHCGWGSVVEGLGAGRALVLLPLINDQPVVARLLEEEKLGMEIPRRERDGWSLARGEVAETVRVAMVTEGGEALRERAREMKGIMGNEELNDRYVSDLIRHIERRARDNSK